MVTDMKLFNHQYVVLNDTEQYNRVAYYLDMGLGKTYVGSEKMIQLGKKIPHSQGQIISQYGKSKNQTAPFHIRLYVFQYSAHKKSAYVKKNEGFHKNIFIFDFKSNLNHESIYKKVKQYEF